MYVLLKSGDRNLLQGRVIMTFLSHDCEFMASLVVVTGLFSKRCNCCRKLVTIAPLEVNFIIMPSNIGKLVFSAFSSK